MINSTTFNSELIGAKEELSWDAILFIVAALSMPHILLLNAALPIKIMEKSLWLALFIVLILIFSGYALIQLNNNRYFKNIFYSLVMLISISVIRSDVYGLNVIIELVGSRAFITIPLMVLASIYYLRDPRVAKILVWGIIATGFTQAFVGVLHKYVFPEIVTGTFASYKGKLFYVDSMRGRAFYSRESGTFGNPSQYADMICLSACLFAWLKPKIKSVPKILNYLFYVSFFGVLLLGLMPSLCRLPIVFTLFFFFLLFFEYKIRENFKLVLLVGFVGAALFCTYIYYQYPQLVERFLAVGAYGRTQKNELLFNALTSNLQYFLIGVPNDFKVSLRSVENLGFGDNSYLQLCASGGTLLVILWMVNLYKTFNVDFKLEKSLLKLTLLLFVFVNFYIGDTIYADGWNLFLFLVLVLFFRAEKEILAQR